MVGTRAEIAPSDLIAEAIEHCVFPLAAVEDVQRDGPKVYVRGEGVRITDIDGREYLDMMSSHTRANSLGYGNAEIAAAVGKQLEQLHYVGTVTNLAPPTIELAGKIADLAPDGLSKVLFVTGGSEAVEAAIKIAKQYHAHSGKAARQQDHLALECLPRRDDGRARRDGLARYETHLRARRSRLLPDPRSKPLPQPVRHGRRGVLRVLCRLSGAADRA